MSARRVARRLAAGVAAAAAFLQRAVALTPDPTRRGGRALAAAQASLQAGAFDAARGLLSTAEAGALDELQRARIDLLRAQLAFASSRGTDAIPLLLAAARRLEPLDVALARETYVDAFSAALFGARLNGSIGVPEVAQAARASPRASDDEPTTADLLLDALVALADDYDTAVPPCREAVRRLSGEEVSPTERLRWLWQGASSRSRCGMTRARTLLSRHSVEIARETGTLSELALALSARSPVLVFCGELSAAASAVAETQSVEEATGFSSAPYGALILAAWRGRPPETTELIEMTEREAGARGEGIGIAIASTRARSCATAWASTTRRSIAAASASEYQEARRRELGAERADRAGHTNRTGPIWRPTPWIGWREGPGDPNRLGARDRGPFASPAERRTITPKAGSARRSSIWVGHACAPSSRARTCSTASGCGARTAGSTRALQLNIAHEHVHVDGDGGVRRTRPQRAPGHGREGARSEPARRATT